MSESSSNNNNCDGNELASQGLEPPPSTLVEEDTSSNSSNWMREYQSFEQKITVTPSTSSQQMSPSIWDNIFGNPLENQSENQNVRNDGKNKSGGKTMKRNYNGGSRSIAEYVNENNELGILRVNQLDAERLDDEITRVLNSYFSKIFSFFDPSIIRQFQPELTAILQGLIYKFSVYNEDQSFGDKLQNLKYKSIDCRTGKLKALTRTRKLVHAFLLIICPWIWSRLSRLVSFQWNWGEYPPDNWRKKCWKAIHIAEMYLKVANLVNFLVFLSNGRYRNIVDRLLCMRLVYAKPLMVRHVSFDFMNRELVWNGFAELILFLFPLINLEKIQNWLLNLFNSKSKGKKTHHQTDSSKDPMMNTSCPICKADPIAIPYVTNCKHLYCYYCIKTALFNDPTVKCLLCSDSIVNTKRLEHQDIQN